MTGSDSDHVAEAGPAGPRRVRVFVGILAALVFVVGLAYVLSRGLPGGAGGSREVRTIAVLPFVNKSKLEGTEHFSEGLTEGIIAQLCHLDQLRVESRSVVFDYKDSDKDPLTIARELGVSAIVTGQFRLRGDRVLIDVELVDVENGTQLWANRFNRLNDEIMIVEHKAAVRIAEGLEVNLTGEDGESILRAATLNPVAYEYYLLGRYQCRTQTEEGVRQAIENFQFAVKLDPDYALAHAGLADGLLIANEHGYGPDFIDDACGQARIAIDRALELDDSLAEVHTTIDARLRNCD